MLSINKILDGKLTKILNVRPLNNLLTKLILLIKNQNIYFIYY